MGQGRPIQARPVDMGLPSGVQWASCNIGAESPSDPGIYFSWGNINGHAEGEGYDFSQDVYDTTPAASIDSDLSLSQDAARANLGEPWRIPTADEVQELCDNSTIIWTTMNGMKGRLFTSRINGARLFFPAAGFFNGELLTSLGSNGRYWSSKYISDLNARSISFGSSYVIPQSDYARRYGVSVRAVLQPT